MMRKRKRPRSESLSQPAPPPVPAPVPVPVPVPVVEAKAKAKPGPIMLVLDDLLGSKAPVQIPNKVRYLMAKFGHWLVMGLMILVLPGQLIGLGMRAAWLPFASNDSSLKVAVALAALLFLIVIMIMALPGLQARKRIGWQLLMLANFANLLYGVLTGGVIGPILGAVIGLYVLLQLKRYYM